MKMPNLLVGNAQDAAVLEITLGQFCAEITRPGWLALRPAPIVTLGWMINCFGPAGALRCAAESVGETGAVETRYAQLSGSIDVLTSCRWALQSRSTDDTKAAIGVDWRGDGYATPDAAVYSCRRGKWALSNYCLATGCGRYGPEYQEFSTEVCKAFWRVAWQLSPQSNRMGYRLQRSALLRAADRELFSHSILPGGWVQVPPAASPSS